MLETKKTCHNHLILLERIVNLQRLSCVVVLPPLILRPFFIEEGSLVHDVLYFAEESVLYVELQV